MLPVVFQFKSEAVQFTLLEINADSFTSLQSLIRKLKLEKYVSSMENTDATEWRLQPEQEVDIFICETMTQGLQSEPQVAICLNIVPQLPTGVIMIPEQVSLQAAFFTTSTRTKRIEGLKDGEGASKSANHTVLDKRDEWKNEIIEAADILVVNRHTIAALAAVQLEENARAVVLSSVDIEIDTATSKTNAELYLLTDVIVYADQKLLMNESALTMPLKLLDVDASTNVQLQYVMGENPGVRVKK